MIPAFKRPAALACSALLLVSFLVETAQARTLQEFGTTARPARRNVRSVTVKRERLNAAGLLSFRREILKLLNAERTRVGAPILRSNRLLDRSSQAFAEDMAKRNFLHPVDPDGRSALDRILKGGYRQDGCDREYACLVGENIAKGIGSAREVIASWMGAASQRNNILNVIFQDVGVGHYGEYWVLQFGGRAKIRK